MHNINIVQSVRLGSLPRCLLCHSHGEWRNIYPSFILNLFLSHFISITNPPAPLSPHIQCCSSHSIVVPAAFQLACVQPLLSTKRARERLWVGCIILVQVTGIVPRFGDRPLNVQCFIWIIYYKWSYFIG
jgi:hypothetical protein